MHLGQVVSIVIDGDVDIHMVIAEQHELARGGAHFGIVKHGLQWDMGCRHRANIVMPNQPVGILRWVPPPVSRDRNVGTAAQQGPAPPPLAGPAPSASSSAAAGSPSQRFKLSATTNLISSDMCYVLNVLSVSE